jgi:hypothetical protein
VTTKTELGVWGFEHFTLYLCTLVERLHPTKPVGQIADILAAGRAAMQDGPRRISELRIDEPESDLDKWNDIEEIANMVVDLVNDWSDHLEGDPELRKLYGLDDQEAGRFSYDSARNTARDAEQIALRHLDLDALAECAIKAFFELNPGPDERDAAVAAMTVGHYDIALDIITRKR